MKLQINRNSWHYKVAKNGGFDKYGDSERGDLCGYFWWLVWGCVWPVLATIAGACFGVLLLVAPGIALVAFFLEGISMVGTFEGAVLVFEIALAAFIWILYLFDRDNEAADKNAAVRIIKAAYRGWKEKTCVLIEIK